MTPFSPVLLTTLLLNAVDYFLSFQFFFFFATFDLDSTHQVLFLVISLAFDIYTPDDCVSDSRRNI